TNACVMGRAEVSTDLQDIRRPRLPPVDLGQSPIKPANCTDIRTNATDYTVIQHAGMDLEPNNGRPGGELLPSTGESAGCCDRVVVLVRTGTVTDYPSGALCRNP